MSVGVRLAVVLALAGTAATAAACKGPARGKPAVVVDAGRPVLKPSPPEPIAPPLPVAGPPATAETITGIPEAPAAVVSIVRLASGDGPKPGRNDLVTIELDGWRLDGTTFLTTRSRKRPIQRSLAMTAPGLAVVLTTMAKGERAMVWVPAELGEPDAPGVKVEPRVYQVTLIEFEAAPPTPPDVSSIPANATRSASGLASVAIVRGTGKVHPRAYDGVTYHYTGWTRTGRIFDSSELRKRPKSGPMYREWPGVAEALALMVVGERRRIWLPRTVVAGGPPLVDDVPGLPEGTLCLELALRAIVPGKPLPPAPAEVGAPPADAAATASGVRYRVLKPGTGTVHPVASDTVEVEYTGWSASGRPFDSTVIRGAPVKLPVSRGFPGWIDALATMVAGETTRFWIPQELAFRGVPGTPRGTVVFDLTLVRIVPPAEAPGATAQPPVLFGNPPPEAASP